MPRAGRVYVRNLPGGQTSSETTVGAEHQVPNLFDSSNKPVGEVVTEAMDPRDFEPEPDSKKDKAPVEADLDAKPSRPDRAARQNEPAEKAEK